MLLPSSSPLPRLLLLLLLIIINAVCNTITMAAKVPPGTITKFNKALKDFDLSLPLLLPSGNDRWVIEGLDTNPSQGFVSNPGYRDFFWTESTATEKYMAFRTPAAGDLTPGKSSSPRTELTQESSKRWFPNSADHKLSFTFSVESVVPPYDKGEFTVAQIHPLGDADATPMLRVIYDTVNQQLLTIHKINPSKSNRQAVRNGTRYNMPLHVKAELNIQLTTALKLTVKVRPNATAPWTVLLNTNQAYALNPAWASEMVYFRAGCYSADPNPSSTLSSMVYFYSLAMSP